ncbi:sensor histidine kinase [Thiohalobacter thiocyanaticus]|uniref:Sensor histidine kinase n=1 Tax=Thiohalobacter thiocyanaticus TaxID=585455 RepID=A0A426QJF6_9GAMM|nr:histidine kinase [Thiohalobacter thiocyanaticus]RRQ21870.1 sensor histidine kinase [Thiohalobacter thiocyanaticus]
METPANNAAGLPNGDAGFLPDFCAIRAVFAVVVSAQLLAFVLALAGTPPGGLWWNELGLVSLFVQWVALSCTAVLCLTRRWLVRLPPRRAGLLAYTLILLLVLGLSELAFQLLPTLDGTPGQHRDYLIRNLAIAAIVAALLLRYFHVRRQWQMQVAAEAQARIEALAARIRPHFLFNSLNTIAALTRSRPELAEEVVQDLAELFRAGMMDVQARIPLGEELAIARRYLNIERQRLGRRLEVEWTEKNLPLDAAVPPLILQPLIENAVYHGIEPRGDGGCIHILATYNKGRLRLEVRNPLPPDSGSPRRAGNRMALENIRQRLLLVFGPQARLETEQRDGQYRVRMLFPLERAA